MPAPLLEPMERVTWRIEEADMDFLRAIHPGQVNEAIRALVHAYCERQRVNMGQGDRGENVDFS